MIKITQVRDGGNHVTQSTLTLDAWVERMKEMAKNYVKKEEELLENENLKEYLKNNITTEKAIQFIVDNAKIKAAKKAEKTEKTAKTEKSE